MRNAIIYEGPSLIDGQPIVCIATFNSKNAKTGAMIQTWILRSDVHPTNAVRSGADVSICGNCPHRGEDGKGRTCYVNVHFGPAAVYRAYKRGVYAGKKVQVTGQLVRIGAYGDPAAVPAGVWKQFLKGAKGWTGYTHQWNVRDNEELHRNVNALRPYVMASCDTESDYIAAKAKGWRSFRVASAGQALRLAGEAMCPASKEAGAKLQCFECLACNGSGTGRKGSIVIQLHGGLSVMAGHAKLSARLANSTN